MQTSTTAVPWIIRRLASKYEWRPADGIATVRAVVPVFLVITGATLCAYDYWAGALLFVVAGLVGWLAYQMPRWKVALDAEGGRSSSDTV